MRLFCTACAISLLLNWVDMASAQGQPSPQTLHKSRRTKPRFDRIRGSEIVIDVNRFRRAHGRLGSRRDVGLDRMFNLLDFTGNKELNYAEFTRELHKLSAKARMDLINNNGLAPFIHIQEEAFGTDVGHGVVVSPLEGHVIDIYEVPDWPDEYEVHVVPGDNPDYFYVYFAKTYAAEDNSVEDSPPADALELDSSFGTYAYGTVEEENHALTYADIGLNGKRKLAVWEGRSPLEDPDNYTWTKAEITVYGHTIPVTP